jgi:hypothetical protein
VSVLGHRLSRYCQGRSICCRVSTVRKLYSRKECAKIMMNQGLFEGTRCLTWVAQQCFSVLPASHYRLPHNRHQRVSEVRTFQRRGEVDALTRLSSHLDVTWIARVRLSTTSSACLG